MIRRWSFVHFTPAAGLVVLFVAVTATVGERERELPSCGRWGASSVLLRRAAGRSC